jgi:hypothetical protein
LSVPRRIPPSTRTGIAPEMASTTSCSASSDAGTVSSCRPPWFDTATAGGAMLDCQASVRAGQDTLDHKGQVRHRRELVDVPPGERGVEKIDHVRGRGCPTTAHAATKPGTSNPADMRNPVRRSRSRRPRYGTSTVRTRARIDRRDIGEHARPQRPASVGLDVVAQRALVLSTTSEKAKYSGIKRPLGKALVVMDVDRLLGNRHCGEPSRPTGLSVDGYRFSLTFRAGTTDGARRGGGRERSSATPSKVSPTAGSVAGCLAPRRYPCCLSRTRQIARRSRGRARRRPR